MTRLIAPANGPVWLPEFVRSIERALRQAMSSGFVVTDTGTGASQDIALPEANLTTSDVLVFVSGALVTSYTISGRTLTLTAAGSAPIVILKR